MGRKGGLSHVSNFNGIGILQVHLEGNLVKDRGVNTNLDKIQPELHLRR